MNSIVISSVCVTFLLSSCGFYDKSRIRKEFTTEIEDLVVNENKERQEYRFEVVLDRRILMYCIVYIGSLKRSRVDSMKVLYKTVLSGNEIAHANSFLVFFDKKNSCIGRYFIASTDVPKVQDANLIFKDSFGECTETTIISFKDSIPQSIFIKCKQENGKMFGDEYGFEPSR